MGQRVLRRLERVTPLVTGLALAILAAGAFMTYESCSRQSSPLTIASIGRARGLASELRTRVRDLAGSDTLEQQRAAADALPPIVDRWRALREDIAPDQSVLDELMDERELEQWRRSLGAAFADMHPQTGVHRRHVRGAAERASGPGRAALALEAGLPRVAPPDVPGSKQLEDRGTPRALPQVARHHEPLIPGVAASNHLLDLQLRADVIHLHADQREHERRR